MIVRCCARCGKELTDAASREHGTGPICRKLDNAALARLIPSDVATARMFADVIDPGALPVEAQPTLFAVVEALASGESVDDWRKTVKRAEWLASWVPAYGPVRAALTNVIRALGYTALAALWEGEAATGEATAEFRDGRLYLKGPKNKAAKDAFNKAIKGWQFHPATKEWSAPAEQSEAFALVVRAHWIAVDLPSLFAACASARDFVEASKALPVAAAVAEVAEAIVKSSPVTFTVVGDYIEIRSPYSAAFVQAIKALPYKARAWNPVAKCWNVKAEHLDDARQIVVNVYGCVPATV